MDRGKTSPFKIGTKEWILLGLGALASALLPMVLQPYQQQIANTIPAVGKLLSFQVTVMLIPTALFLLVVFILFARMINRKVIVAEAQRKVEVKQPQKMYGGPFNPPVVNAFESMEKVRDMKWDPKIDHSKPLGTSAIEFNLDHHSFYSVKGTMQFDGTKAKDFKFYVRLKARDTQVMTTKSVLPDTQDATMVISCKETDWNTELFIGTKKIIGNAHLGKMGTSEPWTEDYKLQFQVISTDMEHVSLIIDRQYMFTKPIPKECFEHLVLMVSNNSQPFDVQFRGIEVRYIHQAVVNNPHAIGDTRNHFV